MILNMMMFVCTSFGISNPSIKTERWLKTCPFMKSRVPCEVWHLTQHLWLHTFWWIWNWFLGSHLESDKKDRKKFLWIFALVKNIALLICICQAFSSNFRQSRNTNHLFSSYKFFDNQNSCLFIIFSIFIFLLYK